MTLHRCHLALLLGVALHLSAISAALTKISGAVVVSSIARGVAPSSMATKSSLSTKRLLRSRIDRTGSSEERVVGASSLENLVNAFKSLKVSPQTIQSWTKKGNFADESFKTLKLDKTLNTMTESAQFTTWVKIVDDFNNLHPTKQVSTYRTLKQHYSDAKVLQMIEKLKLSSETEKVASRIQAQQLSEWLSSGRLPKDIFRIFFKQVRYEDLFGNPNWSIWTKYVDDFNVLHPAKKTSVYGELTKRFNEEKLISMIGGAKAVPNTKSVAFKVESEQCRAWLNRRLSPEDVFKAKFKLGTAGDKLFDDPHLMTWVKYVDDWNKKYDDNTLVASILTQYYGEKRLSALLEAAKRNPDTKSLATRVQQQHFSVWLNAGKSPDKVYYEVLHIHPTNQLLEDPIFLTWLAYIEYHNAKMPRKTSLIDSWLQKTLDKDIWLTIKSGETAKRTKHLAAYFEAALYNKYMSEKFTPAAVSSRLHMGTSDKDQAFLKRYTSEFTKNYGNTA